MPRMASGKSGFGGGAVRIGLTTLAVVAANALAYWFAFRAGYWRGRVSVWAELRKQRLTEGER